MTTLREAAQQALEALEKTHTQPGCEQWQAERKASVALRAALFQEEQEPVAKYSDIVSDGGMDPRNKFDHPPRRKWQSLSEDELTALGVIHSRYQEESLETGGWFDFARAIEAALKEKNA
jgi:outer membrane PBP1 activator LpoA protein